MKLFVWNIFLNNKIKKAFSLSHGLKTIKQKCRIKIPTPNSRFGRLPILAQNIWVSFDEVDFWNRNACFHLRLYLQRLGLLRLPKPWHALCISIYQTSLQFPNIIFEHCGIRSWLLRKEMLNTAVHALTTLVSLSRKI